MINPTDLDRLIYDYLEGQLDEQGFQQLNLLLKTDPRAAQRLAEWSTDREALIEAIAMPAQAPNAEKSPTDQVTPVTAHAAVIKKKSSKKRTPPRLKLVDPKGEPAKFSNTAWYAALVAASIWLIVGGIWMMLYGHTKQEPPAQQVAVSATEKEAHERAEALRLQRADQLKQQAELVRLENERQRKLQVLSDLEMLKTRIASEDTAKAMDERAKLQAELDREQRLLAEIDELATAARRKEKAAAQEIAKAKERAEGIEPDFRELAAKTVGRVVYVKAPENKDIVLPCVIRPLEQGRMSRMPVEHGMTIKAGDRIETMQGPAGEVAATRTALELTGGTTVDVADDTAIEFLTSSNAKLERGQIYACASLDRRVIDTGAEDDHLYELTIQTPAGTLTTASARCEVAVRPDDTGKTQTRVRVETGNVSFANEKGRREVAHNQEVLAGIGLMPSTPGPVKGVLWRGRKALSNLTDGRLPFDQTCPVIWTNDNPGVWFGEDYLTALSLTGNLDCRGLVASLTDVKNAPYYGRYRRWLDTVEQQLHKAPPPLVWGNLKPLTKPASGQYRDTQPEDSEGVKLILSEARKAQPNHPLVVLTAGGLTEVASAWLADPSIAKNLVVMMRSADANNVDFRFDPWAAQVVLDNLNCVIPQGGMLGKIEPEKFDAFPDSILRNEMKAHAQTAAADCEAGLAVAFVQAGNLQNIRRATMALQVQNGSFFFKDDPNGNIWMASTQSSADLLNEFWRAMNQPGFLLPKK